MNKKKKRRVLNEKAPTGKYWGTFAILAIDAIVLIVLLIYAGSFLITSLTRAKTIPPLTLPILFRFWLPALVCVAAGIAFPFLNRKYLAARDEYEYDSFGRSRKKNFSNMSKTERDAIERQKIADDERLISSAAIKSATHTGPDNPDEEMKGMIGLAQVKKNIEDLAAQMSFDEQTEDDAQLSKEKQSYHMCFSGPPGTGKTTVARIITSYLYKYNVIDENKCLEVDGNMFRGDTPAESTQKTQKLILAAMGGVLFIDEAYALVDNAQQNRPVVATIIKMMEDYRDGFVLILAGYENEMKQLIATNPGFKSRIRHYLNFPPYSPSELDDIFRVMAGKMGYAVEGDAYPLFEEYMAQEARTKYFGNARTVRNCLESSIQKHKSNFMQGVISPEKKYILCRADICFEKGIV